MIRQSELGREGQKDSKLKVVPSSHVSSSLAGS